MSEREREVARTIVLALILGLIGALFGAWACDEIALLKKRVAQLEQTKAAAARPGGDHN